MLRQFNELTVGVPTALVLWFFSAGFLYWLDPTSALYDAAVLQKLLFGVLAVVIASGVAFLGIKFNFPQIYNYLYHKLEEDLLKKKLTDQPTCQAPKYALLLYLAYFFGAIACMAIL